MGSNQELTDILAEMVRNQAATRQPSFQQVSGLSQAILSGVGLQKPYQSNAAKAKDPRGPGLVSRVLDLMSRPLYGVLNYIKGSGDRGAKADSTASAILEAFNPKAVGDIWQGLSGKEKTTGRDLLEDPVFGAQNLPGVAKAAIGFGLDIGADPLTYVGGAGLIPKIGKIGKFGADALKAVEEGTGKTAQNITEEISRRATKQASDLNITIPSEGLPAPLKGTPPRVFEAGPGPSINNKISPLRASEPVGVGTTRGGTPLALEASSQTPLRTSSMDALREALENSKLGRTEVGNIVKRLPENAEPKLALKVLNEQIAATKSPVIKNILKRQAEKVKAGVKPADLLNEARMTPPPFPALTINPRWIEVAKSAAQDFLKNNRLKNINHVGQSNLYNKIIHAATKIRRDRRQFHVLQMLRVAEDEVLNSGRYLTDAEGISVRLSDVANISGGSRALTPKLVDEFRKARPSQQIEDLKTFTTPQVASDILDPVIKTGEQIAEATKNLPPSRTVMLGSNISRELAKIAETAGASSREAKTAKAFIHELFNIDRDALYTVYQKEARNLIRQTSTGIINQKTLHQISKNTYEALGENPKFLGRQIQQNKVVEGIMTKFATWWGAKDLKPFSREFIDTARNVAAAFSETMTPLIRATKPSQRATAFSVAQGKLTAGSSEEQALADQFKYLVERLMGTHGITNNSEAVILRSGTLMDELNAELPKSLRFTNKQGIDELGRSFDYTNGNWMHSWKEWNSKEPAEALYQLIRGLQLVTRKNSMWDDAAIRWGMPVRGAEFQHTAQGINRLKGTYFPQEIANQLTNLQKHLDRDVLSTPHKSLELFDKVQRMWKTGVTVYSPSHHIRNLNGDIYLAALDGVTSPKPYNIATKVLHTYPTRYKDLESVFNIMDTQLRDQALRARPGNVVLTTRAGHKMTAEQLYQAAESQGLFIRAVDVEDLMSSTSPAFGATKIQPFGGRVHGAAARVSELRDHWVRLAHFADVITKSHAPLRDAIEMAGKRVKKYHPDGMDLTGFEQSVMRRIIPFYSWMRKATPLVIEGAVMKPHITMAFPKAMANMQQITGIESEGPANPFPVDQMFPDWIREKGIGPILQPGSGLGRDETWRGEAPGYTIVNPTQPFLDQISQIGTPKQTLFSGLTPVARIPLELMTGQTSLGIPLENQEGGTPGYLAQQIPAVGIGARVTGLTRDNEPYNPEQLINWLTSAGVTGTGPYKSQAQTEIRDLLAQIAKKNRGDYR